MRTRDKIRTSRTAMVDAARTIKEEEQLETNEEIIINRTKEYIESRRGVFNIACGTAAVDEAISALEQLKQEQSIHNKIDILNRLSKNAKKAIGQTTIDQLTLNYMRQEGDVKELIKDGRQFPRP